MNATATILPLVASAVLLGCAFEDRLIGNEIEAMEGPTSPTASDSAMATLDGAGSTSESDDDAQGMRVGAVLGSEGLCPYQFSEAYPLTLQFTPASHVCNANLWDELVERDEGPTWYVWVGFPVVEPGVYDLADLSASFVAAILDEDGGGGASRGDVGAGTLEIVRVDANEVTGILSGSTPFGLGGMQLDINGPFTAVRCSEAEWLDLPFDHENAPEEGFDPACTLPGE